MDIANNNKLEALKKSMIEVENVKHIDEKIDKGVERNENIDLKRNEFNKINYKDNNKYRNSDVKEIKRGDIVNMRLHTDIEGNEQGGYSRPCLCIQNDVGNKFSPNIIVVPLTSSLIKNPLPTHVKLNGYGLSKESTVLCEMPMTLSKNRILTYVGTVDEIKMKSIDKACLIATSKLKKKTALEKLPQELQKDISEQLEAIRDCEKIIVRTKTESLVNHLLKERSDLLYLLQMFCEDNDLNYRDFYIMYKKEKETIVM